MFLLPRISPEDVQVLVKETFDISCVRMKALCALSIPDLKKATCWAAR